MRKAGYKTVGAEMIAVLHKGKKRHLEKRQQRNVDRHYKMAK